MRDADTGCGEKEEGGGLFFVGDLWFENSCCLLLFLEDIDDAAAACRASTTRLTSSAKVSSILTISLALHSMNPHPLLRAQAHPSWLPTCRLPCADKSHLFPTTNFTGGGNGDLCRAALLLLLLLPPPPAISNRCSVSSSIMVAK